MTRPWAPTSARTPRLGIPIRIRFNELPKKSVLRPGMNVDATIFTK